MFYERFIGVEIPSSKISVYSQAKTESKPIDLHRIDILILPMLIITIQRHGLVIRIGDMYIVKSMINTQFCCLSKDERDRDAIWH